MHTLRTRFKKDIVCEFLPPARPSQKQKVIILCGGMPSAPSKKSLLEFWSRKNYWVFEPRYRGAWESDGNFLEHSPEQDILDLLDQLPKGFVSLIDNKKFSVNPDSLYLIGGSFGGPAALLASRDSRVKKVVAISPVVDWRAPSKAEPLDWLFKYVTEAYGQGYRIRKSDWDKLKKGDFYNPVKHIRELDPAKVFIIHARDDDSVRAREVIEFAQKLGCKLRLLKTGGHGGTNWSVKPGLYRQIIRFLKAK